MVQEISEETKLPNGDHTGHHIHNQHGKSVLVSTENYSLGSDNENFEVYEESFREKTSLFRS